MQPLGLTAYRLAKELQVPLPRVNDDVRGKRSITADTALRLGIYFGLPAQFWLNLQND
jgi:addiction module HigA family antidote